MFVHKHGLRKKTCGRGRVELRAREGLTHVAVPSSGLALPAARIDEFEICWTGLSVLGRGRHAELAQQSVCVVHVLQQKEDVPQINVNAA